MSICYLFLSKFVTQELEATSYGVTHAFKFCGFHLFLAKVNVSKKKKCCRSVRSFEVYRFGHHIKECIIALNWVELIDDELNYTDTNRRYFEHSQLIYKRGLPTNTRTVCNCWRYVTKSTKTLAIYHFHEDSSFNLLQDMVRRLYFDLLMQNSRTVATLWRCLILNTRLATSRPGSATNFTTLRPWLKLVRTDAERSGSVSMPWRFVKPTKDAPAHWWRHRP